MPAARAESFFHRSDQAFGVEDAARAQHVIDGARQFDGQHGVGLEFVALHLRFQSLRQGFDAKVVPFGNDGRFAKSPAQVGIAQLGPAQAFDLAGTGHRAFDQPTVGQEILHRGEALDVADLVENGQAQVFADARHRLQERILPRRDLLGLPLEGFFHFVDLVIKMPDHRQVIAQGQLAQRIPFGFEERFFPVIAGPAALLGRDAVVSELMAMDAGQQFGATPDIEDALTQQRAQGPHLRWVNVGRRDEIGPEQMGELFRIDAVVFVLPP